MVADELWEVLAAELAGDEEGNARAERQPNHAVDGAEDWPPGKTGGDEDRDVRDRRKEDGERHDEDEDDNAERASGFDPIAEGAGIDLEGEAPELRGDNVEGDHGEESDDDPENDGLAKEQRGLAAFEHHFVQVVGCFVRRWHV
jgi:hypothetical protein